MIYKLTGDHDLKNRNVELGLKVLDGRVLPIQQGMFAGFMAGEWLEEGDTEKAFPLIEKAEKLLKHSAFETARVHFLRARYDWMLARIDQAAVHAVRGLELFETHQYDFWLLLEFSWCVPLFRDVYSRGHMTAYLEKMFAMMGLERAAIPDHDKSTGKAKGPAVTEKRDSLRVLCLGPFRVFRGNEEIPLARWKQRSKARTLFKYLFMMMSRGYQSRDALMELLWPEEDPDRTINKFHVTVSTLRKILEPDLGKGEKSSFIFSDEGAYQLSLGPEGGSDVADFLWEIELAEKYLKDPQRAAHHYMNAETIYKGDVFEEDMYADWCVNERNRLKDKYLKVLEWLMAFYEKGKDFEKCIAHANRYLEVDPYNEHVYRSMMAYYSHMGSTAMAVLTYERCRDNIERNLQCPLSKDIKQYFVDLVSV
jgi:DNA-binding SARP family transcriptional activator